jgi:DNA-binding SARP family transcriptional activator
MRSRIRLLGDLSVQIGKHDVTGRLGGRVGQLAFSYLVLNRERPIRRDQLAAAVWEERAPANPDAALRVVLSRLRAALGADALAGRAELRLALPEPAEVDVERLRVLAGVEDLETAREAGQLAKQELLPGLEADWLNDHRERLAELRQEALGALGRIALREGELALAEETARELVRLEPFSEGPNRLLIETLAARGEQAEALRAYERFRVLLRDELGTSPSSELAALHVQLLRAAEAPALAEAALDVRLPLPEAVLPPTRPALAGRGPELRELEALVQATGERGVSFALIAGEAGIGKSRLASELARRAHAAGHTVMWGRCHREALVPYEPFAEALRRYTAALPPQTLAELAHAAGSEFALLAPDIARRLSPASGLALPDDPQARRHRLFESVAEVLALAASARPLVLVLEDLHWTDRSTALLLAHIVRRASLAPLLVLGTFRDSDVDADHPINPVAGEVRDHPRGLLLELEGLSAEDTALLVAELAPGRQLSERVHAVTEGNPLFVVEIVPALLQDQHGAVLPRRVAEVIDQRLRWLTGDASTLLGVGAVLGRTFTIAEVERISGLSRHRLLDAIDEALAAGAVREVPSAAGTVTFAHALFREVRYRQHSDARRSALHDAAAEAIHALYAGELDDHRAELATHLEAAVRDRDTARAAVEALRQAGLQAAERQAFEDAVGWLERAQALLDLAEPSDVGRCDVLLALAESLRAANQIEEARHAASEGAGYARKIEDGERLSRAALAFVGSHLVFKAGRPDRDDISLLEEAVATLPPDADAVRVRLMARLCTAIYYSERFDEVPGLAEHTLRLARSTSDEDALGWGLYARFWAGLQPDGVRQAATAANRLTEIARRSASTELTLEASVVEWYSLLRGGHPDLVAEQIEQRREEILETGIPIFRWFAEAISTMLAVTAGHFEQAERMIPQLVESGAAIDPHDLPRFATIPLVQLRHHEGRLGELVGPLRAVVAANPDLPLWRAVLLDALVAAGERTEARRLLADLAKEDFGWLRRDVNWLWATTSAASACVALGNARVARGLYDLLSLVPEQSVVAGPALGFYGPVSGYLGPLAALLGRGQAAERHYAEALGQLERVGAQPLAASLRAQHERRNAVETRRKQTADRTQ